jgi:MYXO-CTERM domain-containing protein
MRARLVLAVLVALAAAPAALADGGPSPGVTLGWTGLVTQDGGTRYVALPAGGNTAVAAVDARDGHVLRFGQVAGAFGIPTIAYDGSTGGLSRDGTTLVLAPSGFGNPLRARTTLPVLSAKTLRLRTLVTLRGDFAYDALSPNGRMLYLVQHVSQVDPTRYVVRAYDLKEGALMPGRIADKTQRGWTMQGTPMSRATSPDGRYEYTLYNNYGGYPFVHALDTVAGTARCIGIPWQGSENAPWNMRLAVRDRGRTLAVHWRNGRPYLSLDTATYRISYPDGSPWPFVGGGLGGAAALAAAAAFVVRRRRRPKPAGEVAIA